MFIWLGFACVAFHFLYLGVPQSRLSRHVEDIFLLFCVKIFFSALKRGEKIRDDEEWRVSKGKAKFVGERKLKWALLQLWSLCHFIFLKFSASKPTKLSGITGLGVFL